MLPPPPRSTLFPYTTLFRSQPALLGARQVDLRDVAGHDHRGVETQAGQEHLHLLGRGVPDPPGRSEEHTSELQSRGHLVCRLLLEKKKKRVEHTSPREHRAT